MTDPDESNVDPFRGQGGSYVVDPDTQERVLVERTVDPETDPATPGE